MRLSSWQPSPRERDQSAWLLLGSGIVACLAVLVLAIFLLYLPRATHVRDFEYVLASLLVGIVSGGMALLLLGTAWRGSHRATALAGFIISLLPIPLSGLILETLSHLLGFTPLRS